MSKAKVKQKTKEEIIFAEIRRRYHQFRYLIWAVALALIALSVYYKGIKPTLVIIMWAVLLYVIIGHIRTVVSWVKEAKNEEQKRKRIGLLCGIAVLLLVLVFVVEFWFKDSSAGQYLQKLIYGHNAIKIKELNIEDLLKGTSTPTP